MSSAVSAVPPRRLVVSPAVLFVVYLVSSWGLLSVLAWGATPNAPSVGTFAVLALAAYTTLPLLSFVLRGGGWSRYPTALFRLAVVRPVLYSQLLLPIVAGAGLLGVIGGAAFGDARLAGGIGALSALAIAGGVLVVGWLGSRRLVVREVEARVANLPAAFDGLRIVQVSDIHLGPQTSRRFLAKITRAVTSLHADVVTVTGDLVDDRPEDTHYFARWIEQLQDASKPGHGVYLIPGNHDVYAGWAQVASALTEQTRAHVLVNEAQILTRGGAALALVGVGDPAGRGRSEIDGSSVAPDVPRAFRRVPAGVSTVVFAHNPALWPSIAARGAALTLSGHTHWGQFALPKLGWSLASPFLEHAMGAYQEGESLLYVHPGTGFWGIPFRLGAYPEVARITLRRAETTGITVGEGSAVPCAA